MVLSVVSINHTCNFVSYLRSDIDQTSLLCASVQAQLVVLASQIAWSSGVEAALQTLGNQSPPHQDFSQLQLVLKVVEGTLNVLADSVLQEQPPIRRRKLEHLVSSALDLQFPAQHEFSFSLFPSFPPPLPSPPLPRSLSWSTSVT